MKKIILVLFLLSLKVTNTKAQYVTIPDGNFAMWLFTHYPACMVGVDLDTTCPQILSETVLSAYGSSISSLDGIQFFPNLTIIDCSNNYLTSLPQLPNSLKILHCYINDLSSLPTLPDSLQELDCSANELISLPSLPGGLNILKCSNNHLSNFPLLPNNMQFLQCDLNQFSTLPTLPDSLETLTCTFNQLTSLPALPNTLQNLECGNNLLTSLPTLPVSLHKLYCNHNQITALPVLPSFLTELNCSFNSLNNLVAIPNTLQFLACTNNQLGSLPILPNSLSELNCSYNSLTSLPPIPDFLANFNCSHNALSYLPFLPNTLNTAYCNDNLIKCLTNVPQLSFGNFSNNLLTCVPNQTNFTLGLPMCYENDLINNPNNCEGVNITGIVYKDNNGNCSYNTGDTKTENIPVGLYDSQNNQLGMSFSIDGIYSFASLLPDTFFVKINDTSLPISIDCGQPSNQSVIFDSINQTISNINFPVVCDSVHDVRILSVYRQGWVFPGLIHTLNTNINDDVAWYNLNCDSLNYSGTVTIQLTGPVTYIAPAANALTPLVNGNIFTYNISNFTSLLPSSFGLNLKTDTSAVTGDIICVSVTIAPTPIDADTSNNHYNFCYNVVNSYDPNMKEVYPVNVQPGYDDWLNYTIHFQNTGNAPAFNIRLKDTLDAHLDINSFEVTGSSHAANTALYGNILTVRFNNIMLPDSTTDYEGSMGYFQYRIKPLPNLPQGTQISNTAYIYFDYNSPVVTNTTQNNFDFMTGIKGATIKNTFVLYPNPSNGIFYFTDSSNLKKVEVFNLLGEQILSQANQKQIDLSSFSKGIYFAKINGEKVIKLVKE